MEKTKVVNIRYEQYEVYIGREGHGQYGYFGNPFRIQYHEERGSTLERFKTYFYNRLNTDPEFKKKIHALKGKTLGCFCKPYPCHGDIIKTHLDNLSYPE